jgi:hypothetical protein
MKTPAVFTLLLLLAFNNGYCQAQAGMASIHYSKEYYASSLLKKIKSEIDQINQYRPGDTTIVIESFSYKVIRYSDTLISLAYISSNNTINLNYYFTAQKELYQVSESSKGIHVYYLGEQYGYDDSTITEFISSSRCHLSEDEESVVFRYSVSNGFERNPSKMHLKIDEVLTYSPQILSNGERYNYHLPVTVKYDYRIKLKKIPIPQNWR